jgi:hypothetical protein
VTMRATTEEGSDELSYDAAAAARPARPGRLRALLTREQGEEDGVFRPVRLPLWIDLGISAAIIVFVAVAFAGFIVWLAQTQGR